MSKPTKPPPKPPEGFDYDVVVEQAPDPIVVLDKLGFIRYINATAELISGYSKADVIGKHFAQIGVVAPQSLPKALAEFTQTMTGYQRPPYRIDIVRKDKKVLVMEVHCRPITQDDRITGINLIMRYVGYRKPDGAIEFME